MAQHMKKPNNKNLTQKMEKNIEAPGNSDAKVLDLSRTKFCYSYKYSWYLILRIATEIRRTYRYLSARKNSPPVIKMSLIPSFFGNNRSSIFDPLSTDIWEPFENLHRSLSGGQGREISSFTGARVDWKETPEAHVFKADIPGLKKEEVKVEVEEGNVLHISGERSSEKEEKNDTWHRVERSSGKFLRRFRLPENSRVEEIKAAMEDGVLTVTVPKQEVKKPAVKSIDISG